MKDLQWLNQDCGAFFHRIYDVLLSQQRIKKINMKSFTLCRHHG